MDSASLTLNQAVDTPIVQIGRRRRVPQRGLLSGQKVITPQGQIAVETVSSGMRLLTFDGGYQSVVDVRQKQVPVGAHVIHVPKGVLGNQDDILMLPEQDVIFDQDMSAEAMVDPFVMIQAQALVGHWGISSSVMSEPILSTQVIFAEDEVLRTYLSAMFLCPQGAAGVDQNLQPIAA